MNKLQINELRKMRKNLNDLKIFTIIYHRNMY